MSRPTVYSIIFSEFEDHQNVLLYFQKLTKNANFQIRNVGKLCDYDQSVFKNKLFGNYGVSIELFVRRCLCKKYNLEVKEGRMDYILENYDLPINMKCFLEKHYDIYKNEQFGAMDIIDSILVVALSHPLYFYRDLPISEYTLNKHNLIEIMNHINKQMNYSHVAYQVNVDCDYFKGLPDYIFDNEFICQVKASRYMVLSKQKFYQLFFYSFGHFKNTGKKILNFIVYNPIMGIEYILKLEDMDYDEFEKCLNEDLKYYQVYNLKDLFNM